MSLAWRVRILVVAVAAAAVTGLPAVPSRASTPTASDHLQAILARSHAPEYRRFGSPGMARVAAYGAEQLADAGYHVVHLEFPLPRYAVDYSRGHAPLLRRQRDGRRFKAESVFDLTATTGAAGVTCTVRAIADVKPGDCGFVPFSEASPEWKNPTYAPNGALAAIHDAGGVGAVVQGDTQRGLVYALRLAQPVPAVVAVVDQADVVGETVTLRAMGGWQPATGHDVIGVLRQPAGTPSSQYVMLIAHGDGWFQAAADNGGGAAAVLRAAEELAAAKPAVGVVVVLTDAEEVGLVGSQRLAEQLTGPDGLTVGDGGAPLHMDDVKAVVDLDASSARASDAQAPVHGATKHDAPLFSWRAMVASEEPTLTAAFHSVFAAHQVLGAPVTATAAEQIEGSLRSDVAWFHTAGVPFVWPVAGYPEYHTDGDTAAAVDPGDLEAVADAAADLTGRIAALPLQRVPAPFCK